MENGNGGDGGDVIWWMLGGTAATVALYHLLKQPNPDDQAAFIYTKDSFADMNAVAVRFGQLRELWTMGYMSPAETVSQLEGLLTAISDLQKVGKASPASAQDLATRIDVLIKDVVEYQTA